MECGATANGSGLALAGGVAGFPAAETPVGGWLFYFFWQVLLGLGLTAATTPWRMYRAAAWDDGAQFFLYAIPNLSRDVLLLAVGMVWIVLVKTRGWQWVAAVRYALAMYAVLTLVKIAVDMAYLPENTPLDILSLTFPGAWMVYFGTSRRVQAVFGRAAEGVRTGTGAAGAGAPSVQRLRGQLL